MICPAEWILIRHGESEDNARIVRHPNSKLTEKGRWQCANAAELLSSLELSKYKIICSPLVRAIETASIICRHLNAVDAVVDNALYEFGETVEFGGRHYPQESKKQFHDRMLEFIERSKTTDLIIVTHGGVIAALTQFLNKTMFDQSKWTGVDHCCVRKFTVPAEAIANNIW